MELLAPAGGFSQLEAAIRFGADAVYLAADRFGMRARATNFYLDDIPRAVEIAHRAGVAVHVTCNILMSDADLDALPEYLQALDAAGVDALIISDLGALRLARQHAPQCEYHVSTQASVSNVQAALTWYDLGARRVVCAREMSLAEIAALKAALPTDMKAEVFAHGSMCMAVSGRCLISSYLTGRSGNRGHCTQPCRWMYTLEEEKRPGQHFPIEEDESGSFIMNAQDMNMLAYVDDMKEAGIDSIKIEGRNKKAFYVATIVNAYRQVLDGADPADFADELDTVSHRPYSTGFFFGPAHQSVETDGYEQTCLHVADIVDCQPAEKGTWRVTAVCHNRFAKGDTLEALVPHVPPIEILVSDLTWLSENTLGEELPVPVEVANRAMARYSFICAEALEPGGYLRRREHRVTSRYA